MASETPFGPPIRSGSGELPRPAEPGRPAAAAEPAASAEGGLAGLAAELKSLIREDRLRRSKRSRNAL